MPETKIFEMIMLICFGFAWPISIVKSWKTRSTKGKSLLFIIVLLLGYIAGIVNKLLNPPIDYVLFFYILNFIMIFIDLLIFSRNKRLDSMS